MTLAVKIISGATGSLIISAAPISYVGYTTWDKNNPTGEAWLLSSGYSPNKPAFKSQDHLRHGCSENLFSSDKKEPDPTKDSKLYGCAVMSMDLGHTGIKFGHATLDPKYIKFNSEIAIRTGSEGWVINSRVDNWTNNDSIEFNYILTTYEYKNNKWEKKGKSKLWKDPATKSGVTNPLNNYDSRDPNIERVEPKTINMHGSRLVIKTPQSSWWDSKEWVSPNSAASAKTKKHLLTKHWSGAWIHDEQENSWIFQDIELYVDEKKYSQVFCKGDENACFQKNDGDMNDKTNDTDNLETWQNAYNLSEKNDSEKVQSMVTSAIPPIIQKLKDLKGKWVDLDEVCGVTKNRNLNDSQKKQLSMYCTNKKAS